MTKRSYTVSLFILQVYFFIVIYGTNNWTIPNELCPCPYDKSEVSCPCCVLGGCPCPVSITPLSCAPCGQLEECATDLPCNLVTQDGCFYQSEEKKTWREAQEHCESLGGSLLEISRPGLNSIDSLIQYTPIWLGGRITSKSWRWIIDGEPLFYQGCFEIPSDKQRGGIIGISFNGTMTVETCFKICSEALFDIATITFENVNSDVGMQDDQLLCRCWDHLPHVVEVPSNFCTQAYGDAYNKVFDLKGSWYQSWASSFRNMTTHCAAMDHTQEFRWTSMECDKDNGYICQYSLSFTECLSSPGFNWTAYSCLSYHQDHLSWFKARAHCIHLGGDLVKVDNDLEMVNIRGYLNDTSVHYWIGLTNQHLQWSDMRSITELDIILYPQTGISHGSCLSLVSHSDDAVTARSTQCSAKQHYICQIGVGQSGVTNVKQDLEVKANHRAKSFQKEESPLGLSELDDRGYNLGNTNQYDKFWSEHYNHQRIKRQVDPVTCSDDPCENSGSCSDGSGGMYECVCAPGFTGLDCETDIDDCDSNPCSNGATCEDDVDSYVCTCVDGYTGVHCETEIDECDSNPCANGATCEDDVNGYACTCVDGYTGVHCETEIDECDSNPCANGATCEDYINNYTCTCVDGYTGVYCETDIDDCVGVVCLNNGTCDDQVNAYKCLCIRGFDGDHCENDIDECSPNQCVSNSTCYNLIGTFKCVCRTGFTGDFCETDIDECVSDPCMNGSCVDEPNDYICTCYDGYTGANCESEINECESNLCVSDSTCEDLIGDYQCHCLDGFEGVHCEIDINECDSNPCSNGATCEDGVNGYSCTCVDGYTGVHCGIDIDDCVDITCSGSINVCIDKVDGYVCDCALGFTGANCEINIDECASSPCLNNGTCTDSVDMYTCTCVDGFTGTHCQTDIDDCLPVNPCRNEANCTDIVNGVVCTCPQGYEGDRCQNEIDECASSPCTNGGICDDMVNGYLCECKPGYTGKHCELDIDYCFDHDCLNNATCVDGAVTYTCTCQHGYLGQFCENDINECASRPCLNGATCVDKVNEYQCRCANGYTDTHCQTNIDDCLPNSCNGHGTCNDLIGTFNCSCDEGFEGEFCDIDLDECMSSPCLNGGSCTDEANRFKCQCVVEAWAGEQCENELEQTPVIFSVEPTDGPVSGGSSITILGDHFHFFEIANVFIGANLQLACTTLSKGPEELIVRTPSLIDSLERWKNVPQKISVGFSGGLLVQTQFNFTYQADPTIQTVEPIETIAQGGIELTITGDNFDIVSRVIMDITMVFTFLVSRDPDRYDSNTTLYEEVCEVSTDDTFLCTTPAFDIPKNFIESAESLSRRRRDLGVVYDPHVQMNDIVVVHGNKRVKRQEEDRIVTDKISVDMDGTLEFYIGFRLDGVEKYKNMSTALPQYGELRVYTEPTFEDEGVTEMREFTPGTNQSVTFYGQDLDVGCTESDYIVMIGDAECHDIHLLYNTLSCYPPDEYPSTNTSRRKRDTHLSPYTYPILIQLGLNVEYTQGYIRYPPPPLEDPLPLDIGLPSILAPAIIILVIITIVIVCCHRHKNRPTKTERSKRELATLHQPYVNPPPNMISNTFPLNYPTDLRGPRHNLPFNNILSTPGSSRSSKWVDAPQSLRNMPVHPNPVRPVPWNHTPGAQGPVEDAWRDAQRRPPTNYHNERTQAQIRAEPQNMIHPDINPGLDVEEMIRMPRVRQNVTSGHGQGDVGSIVQVPVRNLHNNDTGPYVHPDYFNQNMYRKMPREIEGLLYDNRMTMPATRLSYLEPNSVENNDFNKDALVHNPAYSRGGLNYQNTRHDYDNQHGSRPYYTDLDRPKTDRVNQELPNILKRSKIGHGKPSPYLDVEVKHHPREQFRGLRRSAVNNYDNNLDGRTNLANHDNYY